MKTQAALLLSLFVALGAAPSRQFDYVSGQVINPTEVKANEDVIYAYLQAGVDTYSPGSVTSTAILDGTIVNNDISSSAAIAFSKLATLTAAYILVGNGSNVATAVDPSGDVEISNTGATTIQANSVALATDTTGNYLATIADAGNSTITVTGSGSENAAITLDAVDVNCSNCIDGTDIALGSDAQGDVMYYDGTNWARLGAGTSGYFLQTLGAGANPAWAKDNWFNVGTFATGSNPSSNAVTGVGFQPRMVFIHARSDFSTHWEGGEILAIGDCTNTSDAEGASDGDPGAITCGADGFTLAWENGPDSDQTLGYAAIR